jgi:hypothetical protein
MDVVGVVVEALAPERRTGLLLTAVLVATAPLAM